MTAIGIGGLAIALALQDTLSNLFAGIHILMEKPLRVGDFVKLETGQEGFVEDIGWRTTKVRMLPNNMVIIPNSRLSQSILTNYCLPEKRLSLLIPIGVSYSSDPAKVRAAKEPKRLSERRTTELYAVSTSFGSRVLQLAHMVIRLRKARGGPLG
ncbi:MAG: mechanosensitive ion channel [Syntrophales bacterium]|nr:mechanosensitive ion channel [Syntrophales bacterium]